jgi:DNA ligase-1
VSAEALAALVRTAEDVRATASRTEKRDRMAAYLRTLKPPGVALAVRYLAGEIPQGKLNVGWRTLAEAVKGPPMPRQTSLFEEGGAGGGPLALTDVDAAFERLRGTTGRGAAERRREILARLLARAAPDERDYLLRLVGGEVRQGALRAIVLEAAAAAFDVPEARFRRAVMVGGDFGAVTRAVAEEGAAAIARFDLVPLRPVEPMLASPTDDPAAAAEALGTVAVEWKLDGVRVQVHRDGDEVRIFSRSLRDLTDSMPEMAAAARALPAARFVLDGEVTGRGEDGRALPFQDLMSALSRDEAGALAARGTRLEVLFFDLLYLDRSVLLDRPYRERVAALDRLVPPERRVPWWIAGSGAEVQALYDQAIAAGHEGVVLKRLDAPYAAGRRGAHWLKAKPAITVDLVILGAEWGSGRRRGWLSNLHLGARVPETGGFAMLGKTFKGLTDEMLRELTEDLSTIATRREGHIVWVRPERVVEIAFDGVQRSPRYASGLALRFARVKRFRPDKRAGDATTLDEIRAIHRRREATG